MKGALTQSAYLKWAAYWREEPWGPWRDNIHAAIIAREVLRGRLKKGVSAPKLDTWILVDPRTRARENRAGFVAMLRVVGRSRADVKKATKGKRKKRARR